MGDGETPSFAEAMVLQKAKQTALEEAGTYVQSYTKVRNLDLTAEEIQTIAGGVMKVEVLEQTRTLIGDGLRFYTKIRATVTTDQMEELARRIRGKDVAEEYQKLQREYGRLNREFATLKQSLAEVPVGPERETALDQLREREKTFRVLQRSEVALFERLISSEALFAKALGQVAQKENEKDVVDALFARILDEGHTIRLGEPQIHTTLQNRDMVGISVPITVQATDTIKRALEDTALALGGDVFPASLGGVFMPLISISRNPSKGLALRMGNNLETVAHFQNRVASLVLVLEARMGKSISTSCYVASDFYKVVFRIA
ncbi:MAG: hypothetical protein ACREIJ_10230, partial [Nitrospiraceae bacterium]